MAVSEAQLEVWAKQGSITQSQQTYARVRNALEAPDSSHAGRSREIFLQGSYGNDTNVWSDSDVDVVIQLNDTFYKDVSELPADHVSAYQTHLSNASYTYSDFKADVTTQLVRRFGPIENIRRDCCSSIFRLSARRLGLPEV